MSRVAVTTGEPFRTLVFGAGAIGTYVGGSLALAGHPVIFVEREEVARLIEREGIRITMSDGSRRDVPRQVYRVATTAELALRSGPFDAAIVALKTFDLPSLLEGLGPGFGAATRLPFLCLTNGVDNEAALSSVFGEDRVIAGTVMTAVGRRAAGDVVVEKMRGMGVWGGHPSSERLWDALREAGLEPRVYPRAADMKWSKLLTNLLANATSAIFDMTPAEIFRDRRLYRVEVAQIREALAVMKARGIGVVDLPRARVRLLAAAMRLPPLASRPLVARAVGGGRGAKMPSFHIDLHSGRGRTEVGDLNGAVVRHGRAVGVPTPLNHLLTLSLLSLQEGGAAPRA